ITDGNHAPLSGIGVSLNSATGAVIASEVTGSDGMASFEELTAVPFSITFADPVTRQAITHVGSASNPLRNLAVVAFDRSPTFELTLSGITEGADVTLMLNGLPVGSRDNCAE